MKRRKKYQEGEKNQMDSEFSGRSKKKFGKSEKVETIRDENFKLSCD